MAVPLPKLLLLGPPQLEQAGEPLKIGRRKALALLAYLAVTGQPHRRETLATLFWPDAPSSLAFSYLRRDLSVLNKALDPACLDADRDQIALVTGEGEATALWVDVAQFRALVQACSTHGHPADEVCPSCVPLLDEAVALYRGDFMTGFSLPDSASFDDWQLFEQESLRRELTQALSSLGRGHAEQGDYETAVPYARRWLQLAPWDENAHRTLMSLYAWAGDRAAALRQYTECVHLLDDELGQPPEETTRALYKAIQAGQPPPPPVRAERPAPQLVVPRRALPQETTPFVNRATEIAEIKGLLLNEPACRLVTLIGTGGIGKTRLALQVANEVLDAFANGVYLVPLAPIQSASLLVNTIADALGLEFQGRMPPQTQLFNYVREKTMLLVLDNFEHIIEGADLLPDLLAQAPGVKLMVTSRLRLKLRAEWVRHVEGLDYPKTDDLDLGSALDETLTGTMLKATGGVSHQGYSAARLFLESVRRVCPDFHLSMGDRISVVRICRLVEGMPLGLELAAVWARMMPLADIEREIRHNLDFLSTEMRDMPTRHRNVRALFEQSWQYLSDPERDAVAKLSVFQGGIDLYAAQEVADATPFLLASLVDKSMLRVESSGRYNMQELLKQFAAEKLGDIPEAAHKARDLHCGHFAAFLQAREEPLQGAGQRQAVDEIAAEIDNLRAAWRWALSQRRMSDIGRSLESLHLFYYARGWVHEGYEVFKEALESLDAKAPPDAPSSDALSANGDPERTSVVGRLLARAGRFAYRLGWHREAGELLRRSLLVLGEVEATGTVDVRRENAFGLFSLSVVLRGDGDYQEARRLCRRSHDLYHACDDRPGMAMSLKLLGIIAGSLETFVEAQRILQEALELYHRIGDPYGIANTLNDLGVVAAGLDQYSSATKFHQECLAIRRQIGDLWGVGASLNNLGYLAFLTHEYDAAREFLLEGLYIQREIGDQYHIANCLNNLGAAACALGNHQEATVCLHEALQIAFEIGATPLVLEVLAEIGALLAASEAGDGEQAARLLAFVLNHPLTDRWTRDRTEQKLAELAPDLPMDALDAARKKGEASELEETVVEVLSQSNAWLGQANRQPVSLRTLQ
jgi:predicted ATPase/DNA-binding SARP family transcriptional activator